MGQKLVEIETPRRDVPLEKTPEDGGVLTNTSVSPKEDLRDILPDKLKRQRSLCRHGE